MTLQSLRRVDDQFLVRLIAELEGFHSSESLLLVLQHKADSNHFKERLRLRHRTSIRRVTPRSTLLSCIIM